MTNASMCERAAHSSYSQTQAQLQDDTSASSSISHGNCSIDSSQSSSNNNKVKHFQVILEEEDEHAILIDEWLYIDSSCSDEESTNQRLVLRESTPHVIASTGAASIQAQIPISDSLTNEISQVAGNNETPLDVNETQIGLASLFPCNKNRDVQTASTSAASPSATSPHCAASEYPALHLPTLDVPPAVPLENVNKSISSLVVKSQEVDAQGKCYNVAGTKEGKIGSSWDTRQKSTDGIRREHVSDDEIEIIDLSNSESAVSLASSSDLILAQGINYSSQNVGAPPYKIMTVKPQCPKLESIIICEPSAASLPHNVAATKSFVAKTPQEKSSLRKSDFCKLNVNDHSNKHNNDVVVISDDDDIILIEPHNTKNTHNTTKYKKVCDSQYICIDVENLPVSVNTEREKGNKLSENKVSSSAKENSERVSISDRISSVPLCSLQSKASPPHESGKWSNNDYGDNCPSFVPVTVNKKVLCQDPPLLAGSDRSQCGYNTKKVNPQIPSIKSKRKDYQFLSSLIGENSAQLPVNLRSDNHQQLSKLLLDDPTKSSNLNERDGPQEPSNLSKGGNPQESSNLNKEGAHCGPTDLMPEVPAVQQNNETKRVLSSMSDKDLLHERIPCHQEPSNLAMNPDTSLRNTLKQTPSMKLTVQHTAPLNKTSLHSLSFVSVSSSLDFVGECRQEKAIHETMTPSYPTPDSTVPDSTLIRGQKRLGSPTPPTSVKKICTEVERVSDNFRHIKDVKKHKRNSLVVEGLEAVSKVSSVLGSLGPVIEILLIKLTVKAAGGQNSIELFLDTENIMTLELVNQILYTESKKTLLQPELKANVEEAWKMTNMLLEEVNEMKSTEKYLGLDIDAIARATFGKNSDEVVTFVQQILKYQSKEEAKEIDMHRICMAVAQKHCELAVTIMRESITPNPELPSKKNPSVGFSRHSEDKALSSVWKSVKDREFPNSSVYPQEELQKQVKCSELPHCSVKPQEKLHRPTPDSVNTGNSQGNGVNTALAALLSILPSTAASSSKGNDIIVDQQIRNITSSDPLPNTYTPPEDLSQSLAVKGSSRESTIKQVTSRNIEISQNESLVSINQTHSLSWLDPLKPHSSTRQNSGAYIHQNDLNSSHTEERIHASTLSPVYDPDDYNNCGFQKEGTITFIPSPVYDPDDKLSQQEMEVVLMKTGEQLSAETQVIGIEKLLDQRSLFEQRLVNKDKSYERKSSSSVELLSNEKLDERKTNYHRSPKMSASQSQITVENQMKLTQGTDSRVHSQEKGRRYWMSAGNYREAEPSTSGRSEQPGVSNRDGRIVAGKSVEKKTNRTTLLLSNIYNKCHNIATNQNYHNSLQQSQSSRWKEFHQNVEISLCKKPNTIYNSRMQHPQSKQITMECGYPNEGPIIPAKLHNASKTLFFNKSEHSASISHAGEAHGDSPNGHKLHSLEIEDVAALLVNFNSLTPVEQEMFKKYLNNLKVASPETHSAVFKMVTEHKSI